jgi:hypothetical protein
MPVDQPLCPKTLGAIETIARRLRRLRCDNSLVAMNLHRLARDLEAIAANHGSVRGRSNRPDTRRKADVPAGAMVPQDDCSAQ